MKIKKLVSLFVAVACLMSCFAGTAFAAGYKVNREAAETERTESNGFITDDASDVVAGNGEITFTVADPAHMEEPSYYVVRDDAALFTGDVYAFSSQNPAAIRADGKETVIIANDVAAIDGRDSGLVNGIVADNGATVMAGSVRVGVPEVRENTHAAENMIRDTDLVPGSDIRNTDMAAEMSLMARAGDAVGLPIGGDMASEMGIP